jgi:hypothetical protein
MITRYAFVGILLAIATLTTFAGKLESSGPDPDAMLKSLYKAHEGHKGPFFDRKNQQLAEQYFTKKLAALIVKDAVKSEGEVGAYDFDPLYGSQDPEVKSFKVGEVHWGGTQKGADNPGDDGVSFVTVTYKEDGKRREMRFAFEQQPDKTWRISEIYYPDGTSLLRILRGAYPD